MKRTVKDLNIGEEAIVKDFYESSISCTLLSLGIVPRTRITLLRKAPFGGAICLKLGGTIVAIRTKEAEAIIIE